MGELKQVNQARDDSFEENFLVKYMYYSCKSSDKLYLLLIFIVSNILQVLNSDDGSVIKPFRCRYRLQIRPG